MKLVERMVDVAAGWETVRPKGQPRTRNGRNKTSNGCSGVAHAVEVEVAVEVTKSLQLEPRLQAET